MAGEKMDENAVLKDENVSREKLLFLGAAAIKDRIVKARSNPADFIEFVWRTPQGDSIKLEPFHKEWLKLFDEHKYIQIEAARSHGKTTIILSYILFRIGTNPNIRIRLFTQSDSKARDRLTVIANMIQSNKLVKLVFPDLKPSAKGIWNKSAITVERDISSPDATLAAGGIMGSAEGGRCDIAVFDDFCDHRTSIMYPEHREAIKEKVGSEILPMIEEDGQAVSIATPHHESDAVAAFRRNDEWHSCVYAVGRGNDPYYPLWPSRWPRRSLKALRKRMGHIKYDQSFRCKPIVAGLSMLKPEMIRFYDSSMVKDPWNMVCIQAYDLAMSQKSKSSFFACVCLLYDSDKNIILVADAWQAKLGFIEQAQAIVNQARKWQPNKIVVEKTGYQSALPQYLHEVSKNPLPLYAVTPGGKSKEMRLMESLPMFEASRIYFNPRLDAGIDPEIAVRGDIIGQLLDFPQGQHDDLVDAFSYGVKALADFKTDDDSDDWDASGAGVAAKLSIIGS